MIAFVLMASGNHNREVTTCNNGKKRKRNPPREMREFMVGDAFECTIEEREVKLLLRCLGLLLKHQNYAFSLVKGTSTLNDVYGPGYDNERLIFFLSLHALEGGFTLPLHAFTHEVLNFYNLAPEQLSRAS
ncbi:hypothetical protein J1N35_007876 [Gossypium stocksii]|uniref:Transposase (putative) gypsy type domain-containing protein n=1 Tax=Gossypium stocksii TaxID=47602 RepID=A0A9D3W9C2_9ROSI|nr:hypothetical protein J1N35_007876 [Gossypium stocksii]